MSSGDLTASRSAEELNKTYIDCTIREKIFENNIYTRCVFRDVNFDNCLFKNVQFIECEFTNVSFDNCKSSSMILNKTEFHNSMIRKSKFNLTVISKTDFTNFRFYNSIFLETNFKDCNITESILENSSFVKTSMINVILVAVRIFSNDFRNSSFQELYFEIDVEIQRTNFSNCKFDDSHLGTPRIMTSIFDDSHFISVSYTDNSKITNCSLENITYENTNIIAPSVPIINEWPTVVLNISESVVSELPSIIGRGYNMYIPQPYQEITPPRFIPSVPRVSTIEEMIISRQRTLERAETEAAEMAIRELRQQPELEAARREHEVLTQEHIQNNKKKIIGITDIVLPAGQKAFDIIDGEVLLIKQLKENNDTIAFYFQRHYYIATRENIIRMISDTTDSDKENNSIVYECIKTDTLRPENILLVNPLVKIASLGIFINGAYIQSSELSMILNDKRSDIKYRIYEIIDTGKVLKSVVSYQVLYGMTDYVGASHCQAGQDGRVYKIRKIRNVDTMLSNLVKQYKYKTSKKRTSSAKQNDLTAFLQRNGNANSLLSRSGGNTKRLCKRKQRNTMKKKKTVKRKTIRRKKKKFY
jgi:uncharacterized protein YjbI with pentapeptide repeats